MNRVILLSILLLILSCKKKSEKEKLEDIITKTALNTLQVLSKEQIPFEKIDSLKLISIDSITESHQYSFVLSYVNQKFKNITDKQEDILNDMRLYSAIEASDLVKIKKTDFDKLSDSMNYYKKIFDNLKKVKADNNKVLDYRATFLLKSHNIKTNIAQQDSIYMIFNKQNQIIKDKEYLKQLISKFNR